MISLPQALALAVGPANVAAAGHAVADWFDGRNCSGAANMIREALQDQPEPDAVPHNRPDTSLRSELMAELAHLRNMNLILCRRVDRLERGWANDADGPAVSDDREPASVVEQPSDEELLGLDQLEETWNAQADSANGWNELGLDEIIAWAQRQALARWGHQPAPPADGEVGELVALILQISLAWEPDATLLGNMTAGQLTRAAELLQQRPEPVPVSERLPGPEDCDGEGRCWAFSQRIGWLRAEDPIGSVFTHWLPATALPLPAGEGE